jgi:AAA ATPase domain
LERVLCPVTVGRADERGRLTRALEAAGRGEGRVVVLTGDAGVGKTRLADDLAQAARGRGVPALWGSCSEAPLSLPYLPFLEAIGNHLAEVDTAHLRRLLGGGPRDLARLFPQLGIEEPPEDPGQAQEILSAVPTRPLRAGPPEGRLQLFEGVLGLLRAFSEPDGLLVVLESMQWADTASRELADYLARRLHRARVMVLVTCRLDTLDRRNPVAVMIEDWRRGLIAEVIELDPLAPEDVDEMLTAIFQGGTASPEVRDLLYERSEGNPFALEEILKDAIDRRAITRQGQEVGSTIRRQELSRLRLPRTVRDSVLGRLEGLSEESAEVVRCASVLGRSFDYSLLIATSGKEPRVVRDTLRTCVERQLLEEDPEREGFFAFRHSLTRNAVYEDLLAPQREELHAGAAEALRERPGTPAIEVCNHLMAARREREAVPLALEAADGAFLQHAYREAAELYERVLPLVDDRDRRPVLSCRAGRALLLDGDPARAEHHLREGLRGFERVGAAADAAGCRIWLGRCYWERSRPDAARAEYEAARQQLEEAGPSEALALAYVYLAGMANFQLDGERAIQMARRAVEIGGEAGADAPRIQAYGYLGLGHIQLGDTLAGIEYLDLSYREAAAAGLDQIAASALYNAILVCVQVGRPLEAVPRLEALKATRTGSALMTLRAEGFLYLWGLGQPPAAQAAFEEALDLARRGAASSHVTWLEAQLALTVAQLDRLGEARDLLPARSTGREAQDIPVLLYPEMRIALETGQLDRAADAAAQVLSIQHTPLRRRLYLGELAVEVLLLAGRLGEARRLQDEALEAGADLRGAYLRRMRARIRLASGEDEAAAVEDLQAAAEYWRERGVRHEEGRTRVLLAEVLARLGRVDAALGELRAAARSAEQRGAALEARQAQEALARLAPQAVTKDQVRDALERLHRPPELAEAPLARMLGLEQDLEGVRLQRLLTEQVELLARSLTGVEQQQAVHALRDYYLNRVGSQEVVAERLHLARATFYRRLHLGWELLAARLAEAGPA